MWEQVMSICNQRVLRDVVSETAKSDGSSSLLSELIRVDLKGRAESR